MKIGRDVRFSTVPEWLIYADVSAYAVRVWAVLDRRADNVTGQCEVSMATIARLARCSLNTAKKAIGELESVEALEAERGRLTVEGDPDSNAYTLLTSDPSRRDRGGSRDDVPRGSGDDRPPSPGDLPGGSRDDLQVGHDVTEGVGHQMALSTRKRSTNESPKETLARRPRRCDPLWDAVVEVVGREPETNSERGKWNKAIKEMRDASWTADEIRNLAIAWRRVYPNSTLTPNGLVGNVASLTAEIERRNSQVEGVANVLGIGERR